ncbi:MFS transporter [Acetobacter senegalensis]|uniref:MFS transporter n=1 Tax=Acetobacter senegalensis TaxID=446692 RepID=UPI00265323FF|nr:MFS transporter [Acetobacter senegalensis]MDN7352069.1 MFS transporter [Acetobacter senegalensis]
MIRLIILLLGTGPLRRLWSACLGIALLCLVAGIIFVGDIYRPAEIITIDVIGAAFIVEGIARLITLAAIGFPNATVPVLKSLGFFALGFMAIDIPADHNIVATIVLGAAFVIDGILRIAAAIVIRAAQWRKAIALGVFELGISMLIASPWPVQYRNTVPFCLGVALLGTAWSFGKLGLQLLRLPSGASVTDLPLFSGPNWHGRGLLHPSQVVPKSWDNQEPLTVYVWTAIGSAVNPTRRPIIDRYIAAMDEGGVISTGHAALSLPPTDYVSLCPAEDIDHSPEDFAALLRAGAENDVPGAFRPSFEEECAEWRNPDRDIRFFRYNADALRAFLALYRETPIYNLTSRNCSSTVALSLDAALEGALGQEKPLRTVLLLLTDPAMWLLVLWRARAEAMTWTPGLILDYAQTLQFILTGRRQQWFARIRTMRKRYSAARQTQLLEGVQTRSIRPTLVSLVMTSMIFGLTYGLSAPLLALDLTEMGFGENLIGANAAMHAVGVLALAPFLPGIAWRYGPKLPITVALLVVAATLALFPIMPSIWLWFPLRFALGAASETMLVMSETWINHISEDRNRTTTLAIYTAALSLGFALGPVILTIVGPHGLTPYLIGGGIALVAVLSVAMPWMRSPLLEKPTQPSMMRYLALAPVAIGATLLNATLETAGSSFLPLYAMRAGWSEHGATLLLSVLLVGAIVLQVPIGWIADRLNPRRLVIGLSVTSAIGALIWPLVIGYPLLAYGLLFLWGGVFVGIYTVMMGVVGNRFRGGDLVSVYSAMSIAWGIGAFVGPGTTGMAMNLNTHGLPYFAAFACALFVILPLLRKRGV